MTAGYTRFMRAAVADCAKVVAAKNNDGTLTTTLSFDASPLKHALDTIASWDVAGPQPTHTATIVVEESRTITFTPRDGETPYDALQRAMGDAKVIRHSEPREI
ncbi:hypothetical protein EVB53_098 [Rhizobium phage RHph_Y60]|nr:hypothetical protein EVB53_098 [Rhizobium phage RHph_Y60]